MSHWRVVHCWIIVTIGVVVSVPPAEAQVVGASLCGAGLHLEEADGTVFFPQDPIFCPLLADPKEPRSFVSYLRGEFRTLDDPSGEDTHIGSVGLGDSIGVVRWNGSTPGDGVQFDVVGSIFAQFDLGAPSSDLINADYIFAMPLTFRRSGFSARAKVYHQSSHLGDEFLLRDQEFQRENLSFESVELLLSQEMGPLRIYGGGERIFRRQPGTLAEQLVHTGLELRTRNPGPIRLVTAVDLKATEQYGWSPATSVRVGLELARSGNGGHPARLAALMLEFYQGPSPYGQFFQDDIRYVGAGLHIAF